MNFFVHFLVRGETQDRFFDTDIVNPKYGSLQTFHMTELTPETEYEVYVKSRNAFILVPNEARSVTIQLKTRGNVFLLVIILPMHIIYIQRPLIITLVVLAQ